MTKKRIFLIVALFAWTLSYLLDVLSLPGFDNVIDALTFAGEVSFAVWGLLTFAMLAQRAAKISES